MVVFQSRRAKGMKKNIARGKGRNLRQSKKEEMRKEEEKGDISVGGYARV